MSGIRIPTEMFTKLNHSSEIRGLCLKKWPTEMLQNLPYFLYTKTQVCFFRFSSRATFLFTLMNALVYMANFEAFRRVISSSINLLFLKSETIYSLATKMRIFFSDVQKCVDNLLFQQIWIYFFFRCGWGKTVKHRWFLFFNDFSVILHCEHFWFEKWPF